MRRYRITIGGQTYTVDIDDPHASPVQVEVDGQPFDVYVDWESSDDVAAVTPEVATTRQLVPPTTREAPARPTAATAKPTVHGKPKTMAQPSAVEISREAMVTSPMPGTILSVAVQPGDQVEPGQDICVLEAMKMKNSIKSPREGTIAEVAVSAGSTVAYGDVLVRFE